MRGFTRDQQKKILRIIRTEGMTLTGWARKNGFPVDSVRNVVHREYGRRTNLTERGEEIAAALREQLGV